MNSSKRLKLLLDSDRTVFTARDLRMIWRESPLNAMTNALRMTEKGLIIRIAKGYYSLNENYNEYELANLVVSPSYVSFQSALTYAGVSFQMRNQVDSVARFRYKKKVGSRLFAYHAIKADLLFNLQGIRMINGTAIASPERAVLDCLYFGFIPDIDNKPQINITVLKRLSLLYPETVRRKVVELL